MAKAEQADTEHATSYFDWQFEISIFASQIKIDRQNGDEPVNQTGIKRNLKVYIDE